MKKERPYIAFIGKRKFNSSGRIPVLRKNDLIKLGRHFLLCADSMNRSNVDLILSQIKAETLIFDPEWDDIQLNSIILPNILAFSDNSVNEKMFKMFGLPYSIFVWNPHTKVVCKNRPMLQTKFCFWFSAYKKPKYNNIFKFGKQLRTGMQKGTRGIYKWVMPNTQPAFSDLFDMPKGKKEVGSYWHGHAKPWPWVAALIANCTQGDIIDPFAGSGSTMIACEKVGRICALIEINPEFCERIIERYLFTFSKNDDTIILNEKKVKWFKYRLPFKHYENL